MKKKSFIQVIFRRMVFLLLLLILVLAVVLGTSYGMMRDELQQTNQSLLEIYGSSLDYQIDKMENLLLNLVYNNSSLNLLNSEDESVRYYASMELREQLDSLLMDDAGADLVVLAEQEHDITLDIPADQITYTEKELLRDYTRELFDEEYGNDWGFVEMSGETWLYRFVRSEGWVAAIYLSSERWMNVLSEPADGLTFIAADAGGQAWATFGEDFFELDAGMNIEAISSVGHTIDSHALADGSIILYAYADNSAVWNQLRLGMILAVGAILLMVVLMALITAMIRRQVFAPMEDMLGSMERIRSGDENVHLENEYCYQEFDRFKETFNHLMDEIMGLRIAYYEKQISYKEAELRCIKLQLRPHFFLNAMTTISSLSMQGKNEEIRRYIDALSKNIRYMFRAGLHTVPLREEIRHVENYFEMQDLKYPESVFYYIDMPEELGDWPIPQLIIHTIIENEYKYAVSVDEMLTILIRVSLCEREGEELLAIDIEDDGKGYPQQVLDDLANAGSTAPEKNASGTDDASDADAEQTIKTSDNISLESKSTRDGTRVGLRSIQNMLAIMYEQDGLFTISNIKPHGCLNHILIPRQPLHVIEET